MNKLRFCALLLAILTLVGCAQDGQTMKQIAAPAGAQQDKIGGDGGGGGGGAGGGM